MFIGFYFNFKLINNHVSQSLGTVYHGLVILSEISFSQGSVISGRGQTGRTAVVLWSAARALFCWRGIKSRFKGTYFILGFWWPENKNCLEILFKEIFIFTQALGWIIFWTQKEFENLGYAGSQRILLWETKLWNPEATQCTPPSHLLYCAVSLSPKNTLLSPTQFLVELHTESRKCCAFVATDIFDVTNVVNTGFWWRCASSSARERVCFRVRDS